MDNVTRQVEFCRKIICPHSVSKV